MKRILLTTIILLLPALAFGQLKVGIMSPDDVLDSLPETAEVEANLQQFIERQTNNYQQRYQAWLQEVTSFAERVEAGELSTAEQEREEERLVEMQDELSNLQNRLQRQIQQRQNELFTPLLNRVERAMEEVSSEMGLDFVINKTASTGDPIVYYSSQRGVDITQRVIEKLTQN
jgi:outer membrane protein